MSKEVKLIIYIFFLLFSSFLRSREKSEAFLITAKSRSYRVVAPVKKDKWQKKFSVIVKNKTLSKLYGKIENSHGKSIAYLTIAPSKFKSIEVLNKKGVHYSFIPLSPSFQSILLDFGKKSYEIPPQK